MTREIQIMTALESIVRSQFNTKLALYNKNNIAKPTSDGAITIFNYGEALKTYNQFILLNTYTDPEGLQQNARELFVNLVLAVAVFWIDARIGDGTSYRIASIYKAALADLLSENYNRITGSKKYSWKTIELTEIEGGKSEFLMLKCELETIIDIRRLIP